MDPVILTINVALIILFIIRMVKVSNDKEKLEDLLLTVAGYMLLIVGIAIYYFLKGEF